MIKLVYTFLVWAQVWAIPSPVNNSDYILPLPRWNQLLKISDGLPPEPFRNYIVQPKNSTLIKPCAATGATVQPTPAPIVVSPAGLGAPQPLPAGLCYSISAVSPANSSLGVTDDERLLFLKYYALRFNLNLSTNSLNKNMFTSAAYLPGAGPSGGVLMATGPMLINGIIARARFRLYGELAVVKSVITKNGGAQGAAMNTVAINIERQIKLLDYMFPDAPIWELMLSAVNKL